MEDNVNPKLEQDYVSELELKDTVDLMLSKKYEERFIAQYTQIRIIYNKLHALLVKQKAGTLDFELKSDLVTLMNQKSFMGQYLEQLEIRAQQENITLPI